jgi:PRTRC genetic system protein A
MGKKKRGKKGRVALAQHKEPICRFEATPEKKINDDEAKKQLDALLAEQRMDFCFGKPDEYKKPITYCITEKGMFQVRKNRIGTFTAKIEKFDSFPKGEMEEQMEFFLPKIPLDLLHKTVGFFKEVNKKHSTEAHVQFLYDTEKKEYSIFVPEQDVSSASVKYENDETDKILKDPNMVLVLDIHSHNTMGAFFSGTDDKDEKRDQCYGVIGHVDRDLPEMKFRFACGGQHVNIAMEQIFDTSAPSYEFPEEWLKKLKEKTWSSGYTGGYTSYPGYGGYNKAVQKRFKFGDDGDEMDGIIDKFTKEEGRGIHSMTEREWEASEGMVMPGDDTFYDRDKWESERDIPDPFGEDDLDDALAAMDINDFLDSVVDRGMEDKESYVAIIARIMHEEPDLVNQVVNKCNHRRKKK